jgi:transcriptional regulator with XRE-family HTH domain
MQSIVVSHPDRPLLGDVDYGARFKQIRKARWKGTVLQLAKKLGTDYPTSIYNIERAWRVPQLRTIQKHATALGCEPWELLQDVETEYDRARALATLPRHAATMGWHNLLTRYEKTTERGSRQKHAPGLAEREAPLIQGSYARDTKVAPAEDIDVVVDAATRHTALRKAAYQRRKLRRAIQLDKERRARLKERTTDVTELPQKKARAG